MNMAYQCSKCNSDTEEGFLLERGDYLSSEMWVSGKPEKSLLFGIKLKGKTTYDVAVFRCIACGYLDSYALTKR
jgi:DNA-directed RNA polymerase subunit RPC12/RpoP